MIHPGSGEVTSSCFGGRRTPWEPFLNTCGPSSNPPFFTRLPATEQRETHEQTPLQTQETGAWGRTRWIAFTSGGIGREELLNGDGVQQGPAGGVLLNSRVVEDDLHGSRSGGEAPSVGVAAVAAVERLEGQVAGERRNRHPEDFVLRAGPGGAEGERVEGSRLDRDVLGDGRLVAEPHGVDSVGHREEHPAGLRPAGDVLHQAPDGPSGEGVLAHEDRLVDLPGLGAQFEVAILQQPCNRRLKAHCEIDR